MANGSARLKPPFFAAAEGLTSAKGFEMSPSNRQGQARVVRARRSIGTARREYFWTRFSIRFGRRQGLGRACFIGREAAGAFVQIFADGEKFRADLRMPFSR